MLIPKSGIFPSEQITSVKLTFSNSPTLMLALNLLNQFTRHFLKWTVCLLWLAPYVDDPSVTFIWMIFTFKIGNYSGLIVVMNGPLFFSCFFEAAHFSAFGIWRIWMFSDTNYLSGDIFAFSKIPMHTWLHRSYIDPVDNIFHNHLPLFRRSYSSWNKCTCIFIKMNINFNWVTEDRV